MRVIGGSRRGMRLKSLPGRNTRPTSDRVKEALFNIIAPDVAEARVLDLFAGTGGVGIEALSRGAASVCFVEQSPKAAAVLRANVAQTGFADDARIIVADVFRALPRLAREKTAFDLVFIDPPYAEVPAEDVVRVVVERGLLAVGGFVIVEHAAEKDMPERIENLVKIRSARYGGTVLTFFADDDGTEQGQGGDP